LPACSSSQTAVPFDDGKGVAVTPQLGAEREVYPAAPYGAREGATIENFDFLGWPAPKDAGYDTAKLEPMSLGQFYDPDGAKGIQYLVITSTAVWCSACKQEYKDMAPMVATYQGKGARFLGALFEDDTSNPAKPSDLVLWGKQFAVTFPF